MFNKISKEYTRFIKKQYEKIFSDENNNIHNNYLEGICYSDWADIWKEYYYENKEQIPEKLNKLKLNLDDESIKLADLILERYIYLHPWQKYQDKYLYDKNTVFTSEEIVEQKKGYCFYEYQSKYVLPEESGYPQSVFGFKNGLVFLPKYIIDYLQQKDFIDGGAFVGDSAVVFSEYNPKQIYSCEPCKNTFEILEKTIFNNNLNNLIVPINSGLGNKMEEKTLYIPNNRAGASIHGQSISNEFKNEELETISITTIDNLVEKNNLDLGLIKLDIEGFELEAIKGGINSIKSYKPILLISVYHHPKDFFEIKPLIENLNLNYNFMLRKLTPFNPTSETVLLCWPDFESL